MQSQVCRKGKRIRILKGATIEHKLFFSQPFWVPPGYPGQNPGISRQKGLVSLGFEGHTELFGPHPWRGRPPPHQKISRPKSLGLGSFFFPDTKTWACFFQSGGEWAWQISAPTTPHHLMLLTCKWKAKLKPSYTIVLQKWFLENYVCCASGWILGHPYLRGWRTFQGITREIRSSFDKILFVIIMLCYVYLYTHIDRFVVSIFRPHPYYGWDFPEEIPEKDPGTLSEFFSWNSPREYGWDPPSPIIQGIWRVLEFPAVLGVFWILVSGYDHVLLLKLWITCGEKVKSITFGGS